MKTWFWAKALFWRGVQRVADRMGHALFDLGNWADQRCRTARNRTRRAS
jgi:hypothetical protein